MSDRFEANYETLHSVRHTFDYEYERLTEMRQRIVHLLDEVEANGWQGRGSEAFFDEMRNDVLPRVNRLIEALDRAGTATSRIGQTIEEAEHEAGRYLLG